MIKRLSMHREEHRANSRWHPWIAGLAAATVVASGFLFINHMEDAAFRDRQRLNTTEHLVIQKSAIKNIFAIHLGALDALEGLVKAQPDLSQDIFKSVAKALIRDHSTIRQIQLSPNAVIKYLYPTHAKDRARGLDLRTLPGQKEAVEQSIRDGRTKTVGPITLSQGGKAIITRRPIYTGTGKIPRFWGFATIMLDYPALVKELRASLELPHLDVVLKVSGDNGAIIVANQGRPMPDQAMAEKIDIPGAQWILAVAPRGGWSNHRSKRWLLLSLGILVSVLCGAAAYWDTKRRIDLKSIATMDGLTDVLSRQAFENLSRGEIAKARRYGFSMGLIIADLDHFKSVNDQYGHQAGDKVLKAVCDLIVARLRDSDLVGRLGGEEFGILVPHTSGRNARTVAERLRMRIENLEIDIGKTKIKVTASFGVAKLSAETTGITSLMEKADLALYDAKNSGRNRVRAFIDSPLHSHRDNQGNAREKRETEATHA